MDTSAIIISTGSGRISRQLHYILESGARGVSLSEDEILSVRSYIPISFASDIDRVGLGREFEIVEGGATCGVSLSKDARLAVTVTTYGADVEKVLALHKRVLGLFVPTYKLVLGRLVPVSKNWFARWVLGTLSKLSPKWYEFRPFAE